MKEFLKRQTDLASALTLIITLILFAISVFEKGLTHDLLLEAGVFLVSIKLVLSTFKTQQMICALDRKLDQLLARK